MKWLRRNKSNRKREEAAPRNWKVPVQLILVTVFVAGGGLLLVDYLERSDWERFRALEITGEMNRVLPHEVRDVLMPYTESGFARIDIRAAREALQAQPWIADAAVRRKWPGTLLVEIREEQPIATWFGTALMNEQGVVFIDGAAGLSGVLPDVGGPSGAQMEMMTRLDEIANVLEAHELKVHRLIRSERRAERFWLANGIEVRLGRRENDARLQRFMDAAWPALESRADEVNYIDMRYTNGFAVGWKTTHRNDGQTPGARSNVQENG